MENNLCPACGDSEKRFCGDKNGLSVFVCQSCRTLFTPLPNSSQAFDYDDYYNPNNLTVPDFINQRLDQIIESFSAFRQTNRFLDVGCGAGSLIEAAQRAKWNAEGIEVSISSVEHLRSKGFNVFHGFLESANYDDNTFDVVTASELIEHVSEPLNLLREIARILRPGGLMWATTPNGKGISAKLLGIEWTCVTPPEHIHLFSPKGMSGLLSKAGFKEIKIQTHGTNPLEILQGFRKKKADSGTNSEDTFNRVETSYELNAALTGSASRQTVKKILNGVLNATRLGDSLKIWAVK